MVAHWSASHAAHHVLNLGLLGVKEAHDQLPSDEIEPCRLGRVRMVGWERTCVVSFETPNFLKVSLMLQVAESEKTSSPWSVFTLRAPCPSHAQLFDRKTVIV
jgi:hypothetical protein